MIHYIAAEIDEKIQWFAYDPDEETFEEALWRAWGVHQGDDRITSSLCLAATMTGAYEAAKRSVERIARRNQR